MENPIILLNVVPKIKDRYDFCPDPSQYIVGDSYGYNVYTIEPTYYYPSEVGENEDVKDYVIDDPTNYLMFYGKTANPLSELSNRLKWFYNLLSDTQKQSLDVNFTICDDPKDTLFKAFCNSTDDKLLVSVPSNLFDAEAYIESLRYKFRKMLEFVENIYKQWDGYLFWYIIDNY